MAEPSTWIKIDRNILRWKWWKKHPVTVQVFLYLILKANIEEKQWNGFTINRGQLVSSYYKISEDIGASMQNVRTAISHLEKTNEVEVRAFNRFSIFTVKNYNKYQSMTVGESGPVEARKATRKNSTRRKDKIQPEIKNAPEANSDANDEDSVEIPDSTYSPKFWEVQIPRQAWGLFQSEDEWYAYASTHREEVEQWDMN